jgi:hypothetical protein
MSQETPRRSDGTKIYHLPNYHSGHLRFGLREIWHLGNLRAEKLQDVGVLGVSRTNRKYPVVPVKSALSASSMLKFLLIPFRGIGLKLPSVDEYRSQDR